MQLSQTVGQNEGHHLVDAVLSQGIDAGVVEIGVAEALVQHRFRLHAGPVQLYAAAQGLQLQKIMLYHRQEGRRDVGRLQGVGVEIIVPSIKSVMIRLSCAAFREVITGMLVLASTALRASPAASPPSRATFIF